jgi:hypothetical protein
MRGSFAGVIDLRGEQRRDLASWMAHFCCNRPVLQPSVGRQRSPVLGKIMREQDCSRWTACLILAWRLKRWENRPTQAREMSHRFTPWSSIRRPACGTR